MVSPSPILPRHATATAVEMPEAAVQPAKTSKVAGAFAVLSAAFAIAASGFAYGLTKQNDKLEARVDTFMKNTSDAQLSGMRDALDAPGAFQLSTAPLSAQATASLQVVAPAASVEDDRLAEMRKTLNDPTSFKLSTQPLFRVK